MNMHALSVMKFIPIPLAIGPNTCSVNRRSVISIKSTHDRQSTNTVTPSCILLSSRVLPVRENERSEEWHYLQQSRDVNRKTHRHRRQPRRGCWGRIPTNILFGGDINGNVPTNIRGGNVVEYELLIASVKRKQR